jgi:tetratricopeptide (TPR) repeat protein
MLGLGVAVAGLTLLAAVMLLIGKSGESVAAGLAGFLFCLAIGAVGVGTLIGLSALARLLRVVHRALVRIERFQYELGERQRLRREEAEHAVGDGTLPVADAPTDTGSPGPAWQEIVQVLHDIRDNTLLSDEEKLQKKQRLDETDYHQVAELIRALLAEGDFVRARDVAGAFEARRPTDERAREWVLQVESSREQREAQDVSSISKQVEDLLSISAWQRARDVARQLQERHPDSQEARQLMVRIEREYYLFQEEQRRRMYAEVQRFVTRKRWEEALAAARTFVERFGGSAEAEAVLVQIPTLQNNAEIEHRQQLEARIMEFARHGRYIEAAELARRLIDTYPDSPQADALRAQLSRLDQLANDPNAPPARIRID